MPDTKDVTLNTVHEATETLRTLMEGVSDTQKSFEEKIKMLDGVDLEKYKKIDVDLKAYDEKNQELVLQVQEAVNNKKELEDRLINIEGQLIRSSDAKDINFRETNEYKAFNVLIQRGKADSLPDELKTYLRTDVGSEGGFLVPEILANEILKQIEEISPVRSLSRVRNMPGVKTLNIPVRTSIPTATYEGERETAPKSNSGYSQETMTAHRQSVVTETTRDILNFSAFDMESEITQDSVIAFAQGENRNFLTGDGQKKPQGILDPTAGVSEIDTAASGVLTFDDVIQLVGNVKLGYNLVYFFNRLTLMNLRTLKDTNSNYLWRIGGEAMPSTIIDFPYVIMQDMEDIATTNRPIGIGDFFRGYNVLDSVNTELIRDDFTLAAEASVNFNWHRWNDGRVVLAEAFKLLKVKS